MRNPKSIRMCRHSQHLCLSMKSLTGKPEVQCPYFVTKWTVKLEKREENIYKEFKQDCGCGLDRKKCKYRKVFLSTGELYEP